MFKVAKNVYHLTRTRVYLELVKEIYSRNGYINIFPIWRGDLLRWYK
jgi:hypothetical protein